MASGRKSVTTVDSNQSTPTKNSGTSKGNVTLGLDNSGSDDELGNLVIDLDASSDKSPPLSGGKKSPGKSTKMNPSPGGGSNPFEHQASVDRGLKMKIKRKSMGSGKQPDSPRNDKIDSSSPNSTGIGLAGVDKRKMSGSPLLGERDGKMSGTGKGRGVKKDRFNKKTEQMQNGNSANLFLAPSTNSMLNGVEENGVVKRQFDNCVDPYDFNAKADDDNCPTGLFTKKIKTEKVDHCPIQALSSIAATSTKEVATDTRHVSTTTEPECLGPCEPGTSVNLEGIVWQETENGMLVVNVTWRGKTFVGTLLDATKHDWAPPRMACDSPTSDIDARATPKGRGKRARGASSSVPLNDMSNYSERKLRKGRRGSGANFQAPPSPAKSDVSAPTVGSKRKGRPAELDLSSSNEELKTSKRSRSCSRSTPVPEPSPSSPSLIECPEPNCNKKYKHINGLRYHQTHAHLDSEQDRMSETDAMKDEESMQLPSSSISTIKNEKDIAPKEVEASSKKRGAKKKEPSVEMSKTPVENKNSTKVAKISDLDTKSVVEKDDKVKKSEPQPIKPKKDIAISAATTTSVPTETSSESKAITATTTLSTITPQVFHISSAPIGCLDTTNQSTASIVGSTVMAGTAPAPTTFIAPPSSGHIISTVATLSVPVASIATMVAPVATITPPVVSESFKSDINSASKDKKAGVKTDKVDKLKQKAAMTNRPIVPALTTKMLGLNATVSVTQSNMSPVSTYNPVSSSGVTPLKPIQPKPAVLGETTPTVNPLAGLKDKRMKKKRNRDGQKSKDGESGPDGGKGRSEGYPRPSPPALIPSKPVEIAPKPAPGVTTNTAPKRKPEEINSVVVSQASECSRTTVPPSSLNLGSPLSVNALDNKSSANQDGMTSPAYSDISDEGAPPLDNESRGKSNERKLPVESSKEPMTGVPSYGMYPYYSQPPYLIPAVSPASHSPRSREQSVERTAASMDSVKIKSEPLDQARELSRSGSLKTSDSQNSDNRLSKVDDGQSKSISQQEMFRHHQQMIQQQLFAAGVPQQAHYQYLAQYQYMMAANDPQYRMQYEKFLEEHQKALKDSQQQKLVPSANQDSAMGGRPFEEPKRDTRPPPPRADVMSKHSEKSEVPLASSVMSQNERKVDRGLQEKKKESHQIMRENIELKSQMDSVANLVSKQVDPYDPAQLVKKQQEDLQRFYMFQRQQNQQVLEHQKQDGKRVDSNPTVPRNVPELKPIEDRPKPSASATLSSVTQDQSARDSPNKLRVEDIKREYLSPDPNKRHEGAQKTSTPSSSKSASRSETPKGVRTPPSMPGPGNQGSAAFPVFASSPYHYSPFDVGHPMYRPPMMGYSPSGYIHPSQMRYHMSPLDVEKEKAAAAAAAALGNPKSLDPAYFSAANQHKIHELKEQAKSPASSSEKSNEGATSFEKRRDSSSPPAQRHLHTHHHTHVAAYPHPLYDPYLLSQPNLPFGPKQ